MSLSIPAHKWTGEGLHPDDRAGRFSGEPEAGRCEGL